MRRSTYLLIIFAVIILAASIYVFSPPQETEKTPLASPPLEMVKTTAGQISREDNTAQPITNTPNNRPNTTAEKTPIIAVKVTRADHLDNSDPAAQAVLSELNPSLKQWFNQKELIRKFVMTVDQIANNDMPKDHLPLTFPLEHFNVQETTTTTLSATHNTEPKIYAAAPVNYKRFTPLITALTVIPTENVVAYYKDWQPLLDKAYMELGYNNAFTQRLKKALEQIIQARSLPQGALLKQPHVFYEYVDAELEQASEIQKFLWRIGPDNMQALQGYAQQLKTQL